jgi:hypothetical protein
MNQFILNLMWEFDISIPSISLIIFNSIYF